MVIIATVAGCACGLNGPVDSEAKISMANFVILHHFLQWHHGRRALALRRAVSHSVECAQAIGALLIGL